MPNAVPYIPRPFVPERYTPDGRLGAYAIAHGRDIADGLRRNGDISAQMWSGIGNGIAGSLREIAAYPAQQAAAARSQMLTEREELKYRAEQEKAAQDKAKAERLKQIIAEHPDGNIPPQQLVQEFGPEDASDILKHLETIFPKPKASEPFTLNPGDVRFDGQGKQIATVPKPEPVTPPVNLQRETLLVGGKPTIVNFNPHTGKYTDLSGQPVQVAPVPTKEPQGPQPSWQWVTRNGKEVYTNRVMDGDTPNTNRVKATEDERKTAGFYGQMSDAIALMDSLENQVSEKELYQIQSLPQEGLIGAINRGEMSEAAKRYVRAFEQFTEARLRPVSGAAISDSEFARDRRTYAKQFKETPALNKDRRSARNRALDSLRKRAGVALDDANSPTEKKNPFR